MRLHSLLCLGLLASAATAGPARADDLELGKNWLMDPLRWSVPSHGITSVSIVNRFGAIRVGGSAGAFAETIELHGTAQHHTDDPRQPQVYSTQEDGRLTIEIRYPPDAPEKPAPDTWRKRRSDITLYLPATLPLRVETVLGSCLIKDMRGGVEARSESGDLEIKAHGAVTASSHYGKVRLTYTGERLDEPIELETLTGMIDVSLPWKLHPAATIETRGAITSDFSIAIHWLPDSTLKRGTISGQNTRPGNDQPFMLRSNRGNVQILRRAPVRETATPAETTERRRE